MGAVFQDKTNVRPVGTRWNQRQHPGNAELNSGTTKADMISLDMTKLARSNCKVVAFDGFASAGMVSRLRILRAQTGSLDSTIRWSSLFKRFSVVSCACLISLCCHRTAFLVNSAVFSHQAGVHNRLAQSSSHSGKQSLSLLSLY